MQLVGKKLKTEKKGLKKTKKKKTCLCRSRGEKTNNSDGLFAQLVGKTNKPLHSHHTHPRHPVVFPQFFFLYKKYSANFNRFHEKNIQNKHPTRPMSLVLATCRSAVMEYQSFLPSHFIPPSPILYDIRLSDLHTAVSSKLTLLDAG